MRRLFLSAVFVCLILSGCIYVNLPGVEPLAEKTIGGKGADKVLVVDISGVITDDAEKSVLGTQAEPNMTARIREQLNMAADDSSVKAVVLRINTPGGSVTTCDIVNHELTAFKLKKNIPVVAELMDVAASGGYYIAVTADKIIAHPTTITGSIGVVAYNVNASGLMDKIGITDQTMKSGANKDIGSPLRPMTEDERRILQSVIDNMYERFLDVIMAGRPGLVKDDLRRIADGRIYTAEQALKLKLIDAIGYMDDAVNAAKDGAHIKDASVVTYAPQSSYRNNIYSSLGQRLPSTVNLVNIDARSLKGAFGMSFMYMWMP